MSLSILSFCVCFPENWSTQKVSEAGHRRRLYFCFCLEWVIDFQLGKCQKVDCADKSFFFVLLLSPLWFFQLYYRNRNIQKEREKKIRFMMTAILTVYDVIFRFFFLFNFFPFVLRDFFSSLY